MTVPPIDSWQNLFFPADGQGPTETLDLRVVKRGGRPFLILPVDPRIATQALNLYSAQTLRARAARRALQWSIQRGRTLMTTPATLRVALDDPFVHFLQNVSHCRPGKLPVFGALAGNPNAPGQRFILMIFNDAGRPVVVVKAGLTDAAKDLIKHEAAFLESLPGGTAGVPVLRGSFEHPRLRALAMGFVEGESPRAADESGISALLGSWVNRHKTMAIGLTRTWWDLERICGDHPIFKALAERLPNHIIRPAIFHGDFVPWNCRVQDRRWTALDWERGDLSGLPGYDWFHYVIQTRILVGKKSIRTLVAELKQLFGSPGFHDYARLTHITGIEWELMMTYLLHHNEVIRPGEGLERGRKLLIRLAEMRKK